MGPLKALYAHHKDAVRAGLRQMLESKRPYIARIAALGLSALISVDGTLTSFLASARPDREIGTCKQAA
jgi:hypothetical protein